METENLQFNAVPILWNAPTNLIDQINNSKFSEEVKEIVKDKMYEQAFAQHIASTQIPLDVIESRTGGKAGELEYIEEFYYRAELDRLFPGWSMIEMRTEYIASLHMFLTQGYGVVDLILPSGRIRKRQLYAAAGQEVQGKVDDKTLPSNPQFAPPGAVTRWLKLFGKQLNIGLEIYHQKITPELRGMFEDMIRDWKYPFAEPKKEIAKTIETGQGFRRFLKSMPTKEQTARWIQTLAILTTHNEKVRNDPANLWKAFTQLSNANKECTDQTEKWLQEMEAWAIKLDSEKTSSNK